MNDAEYETQKQRVERLIERWVKPIGLGWWCINWVWHREERRSDDLTGIEVCAMDCHANWKYLEARINVYLPAVEQFDDDRLEYFVVHELMHVFLQEMQAPMQTQAEADTMAAHEERVATTLAHALIWARQAGYDEGLAAQAEQALAEA